MPPKKNAKKGKKGDDDAFWAEKEAKIGDPLASVVDDADIPQPAKSGKKGKKTAFEMLEDFEAGNDDDDSPGGGLMAAIASSKERKKKTQKKPTYDDEEDDFSPNAPAPAAPEVANMDEEWPEDDVKPKKGKKAKGKKSKVQEDFDEDMDASAPAVEATPAEPEVANMDDEWPEDEVKPKKGKKAKGKKSKVQEDLDDDIEVSTPAAEAVSSTAEPQAADIDDEWPEEDVKPKKGGKKGKQQNASSPATPAVEEAEAAPSPAAPGTPAEPAGSDAEEGGVKILSKKEKERLKKEKEKARKKAQAAAKKGAATASAGGDELSAPTESAAPEAQADAAEDVAEETGAGASDKKKKKKKKAASDGPKEEPAAKPKKVNARVAALQAALAEQKALEEAAKRKAEEEERLRLAEEARIAEEERKAEEEKQLRKEKEKAKKEQLRKEGKLLTAKQKREQQMAALRKEQLLASGVVVEGLQNRDEAEKPKKVVYGNRKKQQPKKVEAPSPAPAPVAAEPEKKEAAEESGDDWNKSDDEKVEQLTQAVDKTKIEDSGDDWDKSSDEEEEVAKPAPTPAAVKAETPAAGKPAANGKPAPAKSASKSAVDDSSSEEETDSDEDSDSDDSSDDDSDDSDSDSSDDETPAQRKARLEKEQKIKEAAARRAQRHDEAMAARSKDDLRSPICCILGHVDTGKTKLLDKIRQTNVQEGEAGGITQQIGATYFPLDAIKEKTRVVNKDNAFEFKVPGLLIIDTPGHESFTNLRSRGSSLCNIAILVVDITHGLEPQTLESIRLLKERKTPFIVALNKIDRCYGWKEIPNGAFRDTYEQQAPSTKREFQTRLQAAKLAFAEQGFNSELYYENNDLGRTVSLVPTSAITGEGVPDMIMLLVKLTQQRMTERLMYLSELECTVLEVKVIEGLGTTIDVILSNGVMREGDRIVVCGMDGAIATNVRALLTPQPLRELRVKSQYVHHKEVKAALGIKIAAPGLEKAIAGSRLFVVGPDDDEDDLMAEVESDLKGLGEYLDPSGRGVYVQASTLGSLEALLEFLRSSKIPVGAINIGPVYRKDIMKCAAMLEKAPEYAVVLCFDVPVDRDARAMAEELNVKVFEAQIIYHLFDAFKAYMEEVLEARRKDAAPNAVWPCRLKTLRAFAKRDPIVLGVDIIEGSLRVGTPICVVKVNKETGKKDIIPLGKITSIEINHVTKDIVKKAQIGAGAAIKIEHAVYQSSKAFGRHFDEKDELISHITRQSIDVLKNTFRNEVEMSDWALIKQLKPRLDIA